MSLIYGNIPEPAETEQERHEQFQQQLRIADYITKTRGGCFEDNFRMVLENNIIRINR